MTICEIAATSGPFSALGTDDELGATAWAAMVNKAGGVQGHQVKLVQENDASNPATAAALVHKCVTQVHANFIFGPESTATTAAAVPVANQLQTVLLGWASGWNGQGISDSQPELVRVPRHRQRVLRRRPGDDHPVIVPRHYTRVAVIQDNTPGGLSNVPYMQGLASKYGYQVVASQIVNPGATNDTPQVLNLLKANPQVIVLGLTPDRTRSRSSSPCGRRTRRSRSASAPGARPDQFVNAVGGPTTMSNIYLIGTPRERAGGLPVQLGQRGRR